MFPYTNSQNISNGMVEPAADLLNAHDQGSVLGTSEGQNSVVIEGLTEDSNGKILETPELNDVMMEESLQEFRRQSLAGFQLPQYMDFGNLSDASLQQRPIDESPHSAEASVDLQGSFGNALITPRTSAADLSSTMIDLTPIGTSMVPPLQAFVPQLSTPGLTADGPIDPLDTSPVPMHQAPPLHNTIAGLPQGPTSEFEQKNIRLDSVYSSSGFDMIGLLMRVATRPNPQINIGAVDMSCAFVVCDARKYDMPIVYCSATFERLTGYTKHEILGRNCRFLQSPTGDVEPGVKRKYVDDDAVRYLKIQCDARKESQTSLINYRKGGQPFMNLLTTIPIQWDSSEIAYFVGFQVDLVDQPGSIMNKNQDGSIVINYQHRQLPTFFAARVIESRSQAPGTTISRDDVSQILSNFGAGDSELSRRLWDKVLLENTDDVVHVLSLKGLFLYCSPSTKKILEYDPQDLVGSAISTVCHPSDIVPVTRDLKDTSTGTFVNVVFRIRRKFNGYMWFESFGCLHTEQGKGRKCIILVGRERPVYKLRWRDVTVTGGIGDNEMWTKLSPSGMFLFVSSSVKSLLDRDSEDLMGTSIQALMRPESRMEVAKALENARLGKRGTVRHEVQNRRGQFLQALTIVYPGDGHQDQKTTFLIAQTRLLKHSRSNSGATKNVAVGDAATGSVSSLASTPSGWSSMSCGTATPDDQKGDTTGEDQDRGDENVFDELKTTRSSSWQFELRQMQRTNKRLAEELSSLLAIRKKRKRRKGADQSEKDCANCHTRVTPEWRRGPSGKRDLCNSCGLRYAKLVGRVSPRTTGTSSNHGDTSPQQPSPLSTQSINVDGLSSVENKVTTSNNFIAHSNDID